MKRKLYTTSEYIEALAQTESGKAYQCKGKDFMMFATPESADHDAQWLVDFYKREGVKKKRPLVYKVKFERVK